jgi:predicted neutral ceramidase superfamily lipid hydrolase
MFSFALLDSGFPVNTATRVLNIGVCLGIAGAMIYVVVRFFKLRMPGDRSFLLGMVIGACMAALLVGFCFASFGDDYR